MDKRIQIPLALYEAMVGYIGDHYDPHDRSRFDYIQKEVKRKREAESRRNMYSAYKSQADPEEREKLRQAYLDEVGIPSHGRWGEETEAQFRKGNFDF